MREPVEDEPGEIPDLNLFRLTKETNEALDEGRKALEVIKNETLPNLVQWLTQQRDEARAALENAPDSWAEAPEQAALVDWVDSLDDAIQSISEIDAVEIPDIEEEA